MKKKINYQLKAIEDISNYVYGYRIVSSTIGFNKNIYVLLVDEEPQRIDGMFVKSKLSDAHTYKVLILDSQYIFETYIYNQFFNYHFLQPLQEDKLLLVGARTRYYGNNKYDLNGKIVTLDGVDIIEILLGDGIENVQVSKKGKIWTSYFDEGVFGNYGWNPPVGASGLVAWDEKGNKVFSNNDADICDCYALNVVNDNQVWFYYYSDFNLGKIENNEVDFYNPNISGSSGFIVFDNFFLFDAGYSKHNEYILLENRGSRGFKTHKTIKFVNEEGKTIKSTDRDFRGDMLILREENKMYQVHLREIVNDIM
ncbi:hypothetical protein [Caldalkalibacillus salinus]|uniref:hypothetical protein n=1 Tax=Caldalkalibacillus salinus TaxID=2803787 RepID=UPI0019207B75|nr:hypothetical protein [Caldalkalibacillus salinus]